MAEDRLVDSFRRTPTEEVRATLRTYRGRQYVDLRIYFQDNAGEFRPTKKGIRLSVDLLDELTRMVGNLAKAVQAEQAAGTSGAGGEEAPAAGE